MTVFRPRAIVDHPFVVLATLVAVSAASVWVLLDFEKRRLTIDVDPASEPLIQRSDPGIPIYEQAKKDFGNDDVYVIAMETEDVFQRGNLERLSRLTEELLTLPGVASVESLTRVLSVRYDTERELVAVSRLMKQVPTEPSELADLRRRALADPIYPKTLVSKDGRTAAISITFQPMTDGDFVALGLDERIEEILGREKGPAHRFYVAGRPHIRSKAYHLMTRDMAMFIPLAVVIASVCMGLMLGSFYGTVIPVGAGIVATLWVFGGMAALSVDINLISLVLAPMMICIGAVYGIHVYARYEVIAADAVDPRSAALDCLRYVRTPVLMAGLTTCIGFAALLLTDIPATNELGAFSILGVASVTLISLTGIPAALVLLPVRGRRELQAAGKRAFHAWLDWFLVRVERVAIGRSGSVLLVSGLLVAGSIVTIPRIVIDTDVINFFVSDSPVRKDFFAVNRLLTGVIPISVPIAGNAGGDFRKPETLGKVVALQERLEALPGVTQVLSSVDYIRLVNRAMMEDDESQYVIPKTRAGVAEATFILPKPKLRRFSTSDHSRNNLIVRTGEAGSAKVRALEERIRGVLADADLPEGFTTAVTGNSILLNRSADGIAKNQATQVGFAALGIFFLICVVFRSIPIGLIAMVPNIIPVVVFFGILGLGIAPLSLPTSLIGSIALGIAIDDTMHFLVAYRELRTRGASPEEAAAACIRQVGRPVFMTSVMLVVGFLVMLVSGFATLREFGYLTALTMAICLMTDLLLLPALLVRVRA